MNKEFLQTPDSVVFRQVLKELVVIQLNTGQILYFSEATQDFLNFFKQPKRLDSYLATMSLEDKPAEVEHVRSLVQFLIENQLMEQTAVGNTDDLSVSSLPYSRPEFLRLDEKTLDEIAFLCP